MTTYPYSLADFAERLLISSVIWDIQRNDAVSGQGSGAIIAAELGPPLWIGTITLIKDYHDPIKQIAAKVRKLHGAQERLFLYDPLSKYPQSDKKGQAIAGATVSIASVSSSRDALSIQGLPAFFKLLPGDKMSISYGASPTRYAFLEVSDDVTANGAGVTAEFGVFPHIPLSVTAGLSVTLVKPACQCIVMPGSHNPGTASGLHTEGAGFKVIQKK